MLHCSTGYRDPKHRPQIYDSFRPAWFSQPLMSSLPPPTSLHSVASLRRLDPATGLCGVHLEAHYRRLGRRSLRLRFLGEPSDAVLDRLVGRAEPELLLEAVVDGGVRGVFEAYPAEPGHAEIALSVENEYQGRVVRRYLFDEGLEDIGTSEALLRVQDNGPGLREPREGSQGLRLVRSLAGQLSGRLEMESSNAGTTVTLIFPVIE